LKRQITENKQIVVVFSDNNRCQLPLLHSFLRIRLRLRLRIDQQL